MWNVKNFLKTRFFVFAMLVFFAPERSFGGNASFEEFEAEIQNADFEYLPILEHKIARLMQEKPLSLHGQYLMSTLLLRQFLSDPANTDLVRQSADLAAQTYELNPKSELGIVALANVLAITGDTTKGIALMRDVEKKQIPLSWRYHLAMANLLASEQGNADLIKELTLAMTDPTANRKIVAPYVVANLSTLFEGQELLSELQNWQSKYPCHDFKLALAQMETKSGNLKLALAMYRDVLKEDPKNPEALLGEGFALLKSGQDYRMAALSLGKAVELKLPNHIRSEARLSYAVALIRAGKHAEGATEATAAISMSPNAEAATIIMANEFNKQKRYDETIAFLDKLNERVPGISISHAIRGEVLNTKLRKSHDAIYAFSDAIVLDNSRATYYNGRGLAYYGLHNLQPALTDFETAVRMDPTDASARYNTACTLALLGRKNDAIAALASALDLDERLTKQALVDNDFKTLRSNLEFQTLTGSGRTGPLVAH